jgi:hypothetical protein
MNVFIEEFSIGWSSHYKRTIARYIILISGKKYEYTDLLEMQFYFLDRCGEGEEYQHYILIQRAKLWEHMMQVVGDRLKSQLTGPE